MDAPSRNSAVKETLGRLFQLIGGDDIPAARSLLPVLEARLGADDPDVIRATALMSFLEDGI